MIFLTLWPNTKSLNTHANRKDKETLTNQEVPTKGEGEEEENSRIIETRSKENISQEKTMRAKNRKDNNRMMKDNTDESI